ncbi:MAG TPA: FHA domain-containing protein [Chthoniobacter sp.]|jgi:hypothetical protein
MSKAACLILFALCGGILNLCAQEVAGIDLKTAEKPSPPRLELQLRLPEPWPVKEVAASSAGKSLPVKFSPFDPNAPDSTALLFLIDRSDPARAKTVEAVKALVQRSIDALDEHTVFAVYAFDADLVPVAEFGTPKPEALAKLKSLKAVGMATELYRDTIDAVKILEATKAARKALILFSDGKAEDTTFSLQQTVSAAKQAGVAICGVGYAEKPSATIHLQSMRQLADGTCGYFVAADIRTKKEPPEFLHELLARLRSGGQATVDLSGLKTGRQIDLEFRFDGHDPIKTSYTLTTLAPTEPPKEAEVEKKVDEVAKKMADMAKNMAQVPSQVDEAAKKAAEESRKIVEQARAADEAARQKKQAEEVATLAAAAKKKRFIVAAELCGLALVLLVVGFVIQRRRQQAAKQLAERLASAPIYARLQVLDGDGTELLMRTTALRVGRGKDNDLALKNDSVSRHHAEIHRTREGDFTITELNSGNGVIVNGEPVTKTALKNDDIIELGEVRIRFLIA